MPLENGLNLTTMPLSPNGMASGLHPEIIGIRLPAGVLTLKKTKGTNKESYFACFGNTLDCKSDLAVQIGLLSLLSFVLFFVSIA